nr:hypothetical protein Iba_chr10bCG5560 [Ipomoea batatas]
MRMNMSTRVDSTTLAPLFRHKKLRKMSTPVDSTTPAPLLCRKKLFLMMIN